MKFFILSTFIYSFFIPVFSEEDKNYKKENFDEIKTMKIKYLNKTLDCVNNSKDFKQLKKCARVLNKRHSPRISLFYVNSNMST